MPDMPESVSKPAILKNIDQLKPKQMSQLLAAFEQRGDKTDIAEVMDKHGLLTPNEKKHLQLDWFNSGGKGWWPKRQPIQEILARGFITALQAALSDPKKPLPVDCYWVCCTGHHDKDHTADEGPRGIDGAIEVAVLKSDRHVTVLIHTPGGGKSSVPQSGPMHPEPIAVVARDANGLVGVFRPDAFDNLFQNPAS
jgi:hypothetical protein